MAALVLAAGAGRRIGRSKALLPHGETTFLDRIRRLYLAVGVDEIIAVLSDETMRRLADEEWVTSLRLVVNRAPERGMLSSLIAGLAEAENARYDAVIIHPVDHPLVASDTILAVVEALREGARVAVPSRDGRRGHPTGFARDAWHALRNASPERGARAVLAEHPEWIVHVPGDAGCLSGIDTREDYERLIGPLPSSSGRPVLRRGRRRR